MSRRSDRAAGRGQRIRPSTPITLRYAHAFQLAEARLVGRCGQVGYAMSRIRWARRLRLEGRGSDIDPQGGFQPLP